MYLMITKYVMMIKKLFAKEGTNVKKWRFFSSICLATTLLVSCNNVSQKDSNKQANTENSATKTKETVIQNKTTQQDNSKKQVNEKSKAPVLSGQKMTNTEQKKLENFVKMYPVKYGEAIESGDFTPLANEYIMHETLLYESLLSEIPKKHKEGKKEDVKKVEITSINRVSDTDFIVKTTEIIENTQNGTKETKTYHREYTLYYDYIKGDDQNSFFKISDIKETK